MLAQDLFPTFDQLPYDNDFDTSFYEDDELSILNSRHHWCFFYCSDVSKRPIRTRSLSLKCAELRCKKKSALADILAY